jgi:hypothetical protein
MQIARIDLRQENEPRRWRMDFMEMREALNAAGRFAVNGNEEGFYGARPLVAGLAIAGGASVEAISRHAAQAVCIAHGLRSAPEGKRKPD